MRGPTHATAFIYFGGISEQTAEAIPEETAGALSANIHGIIFEEIPAEISKVILGILLSEDISEKNK